MDDITYTKAPINEGLFDRVKRCKLSKTFAMEGPLYTDLFRQKRLVLNGVQVGVRLYPTSDQFRLMSEKPKYRVEIMDAVSKVCHVKVSPGILLGHAAALKITRAKYFFDESVIKTYAIAAGQYSTTVDDLFQGEVPKSLKLCLVSSQGLSGSCTRNPFNFENYDLNFCGFYVDGQSCPSEALQPLFGSNSYVDAYMRLFKDEAMNGITYNEFGSGYAIYAFDLSDNSKQILTIRKKGHTRLELRFSKPLPETATLVVYAKFGQVLSIDESRSVKLI
jgi:hypothetical protein